MHIQRRRRTERHVSVIATTAALRESYTTTDVTSRLRSNPSMRESVVVSVDIDFRFARDLVPKTEASLGQLWAQSGPRSVSLYEAVSITAENSLARIAWYG